MSNQASVTPTSTKSGTEGTSKKTRKKRNIPIEKQIDEIAQMSTLEEFSTDQVIGSIPDFRAAVGQAQLSGQDYVIVTDEIFKYLLNGGKSSYICYGSPTIRVYKEGTRDKIEADESKSVNVL